MKQKKASLILTTLFVGLFAGLPFATSSIKSSNLTLVSDTLSNPRLSFYGLTAANVLGSSLVTIQTSSVPSGDSTQLASPSSLTKDVLIGGTVYILDGVAPNADTSKFSITTGLAAGDIASGKAVVATQSSIHTIKFKPASAVPNGSFRVLIQATDNTGTSADGIPDGDGFDFSTTTPTVTCPTDVSSYYDFVAGTASAQAVTVGSLKYHSFECRYSGPGNPSEDFNANPMVITRLINPAPRSGHTVGTSDPYKMIVQNLGTSTYPVVDQTATQIGVIEGVRVTATVPPQITFTIAGVADSATECSLNLDVTTTATSVPFGELTIDTFRTAAQTFTVSTNAYNGWVVTAQQNDNLGMDAIACPDGSFPTNCIADVSVGGITYGSEGAWATATDYGFGYTLEKNAGNGAVAFSAPNYKQFADLANLEPAQSIFSDDAVGSSESYNVCYKVAIGATQAAGDYENIVSYTATATF